MPSRHHPDPFRPRHRSVVLSCLYNPDDNLTVKEDEHGEVMLKIFEVAPFADGARVWVDKEGAKKIIDLLTEIYWDEAMWYDDDDYLRKETNGS